MTGRSEDVIAQYLGSVDSSSAQWQRTDPLPPAPVIVIENIAVHNARGDVASSLGSTDPVTISIGLHAPAATPPVQIALRITNHEGVFVFTSANTDESRELIPLPQGRQRYQVRIPPHFLAAGTYNVLVAAHIPRVTLFDHVDRVNFAIEELGRTLSEDRVGVVTPALEWEHQTDAPSLATMSGRPERVLLRD
jgi:hypothetical protein